MFPCNHYTFFGACHHNFSIHSLTIQLRQLWALRTSCSEDGVAALSWPPSESDDDESSMHTLYRSRRVCQND